MNGSLLGVSYGSFVAMDAIINAPQPVGLQRAARNVLVSGATTGLHTAGLVAGYCGASGFSHMLRGGEMDWVDASVGGVALGALVSYGSRPFVMARTALYCAVGAGALTYLVDMRKNGLLD